MTSPILDENSEAFETRFREYFESFGCRIDIDDDYRDRYFIDYCISRVRGIHAAVNLGLHLTRETDDRDRQETFLEAARLGVVAKSIYVEVCTPSLDTGVIPLTHIAALSFLFDRRYHHARSTGLRLFEDSSFHFFDLEENVRRLRKDYHDAHHDTEESLRGDVIAYFSDKGFGFIEDDDNQKFFFHIANVVDEELRRILPTYAQGESVPVLFSYGGSDGKKYPKAIEVSGG